VSDFGVAKSVNPMTLYASAGGTPLFKGPEAMRDNQDSPAGDVWGVGTTLYMMLTDLLPFPTQGDRSPLDLRRFDQPLRPASDLNAEVGTGLDAIVARCLALRPADRYPDASALLADLLRWMPGALPTTRKGVLDGAAMTTTKDALGLRPPADRAAADALVREALRLSKQPGKLPAAADMMEEAISKSPDLRDCYEAMLRLWRRGLCM
jgi:serine/threonine-protein kinase